MDPRFGGNVGAMLGSQEVRPQGNYLQRQLQRFTGGIQRGTDRLFREYNNMDRKYFGGGLPFGASGQVLKDSISLGPSSEVIICIHPLFSVV